MTLAAVAALTAPASAADPRTLAAADVRAVRAVVEAQLAALAAGDAERAFSYAGAGIRSQFGTAEAFMAMVIGGYPMVVRPARVAFLQPLRDGDAVRQGVRLRDAEGRAWRATYALALETGAGWRIEGCSVVRDDERGST